MSNPDERLRTSRGTSGNPDTRTDDRADRKLPVTGEVGSEGGSYADPTYQVSAFEGDLGREAEATGPPDTDAQTKDSIKPATE